MEGRRVSESTSEYSELALPNDANGLGNLLGGKIMHLVDLAGAIAAMKHCRNVVVTASVDHMDFIHPVRIGQWVRLRSSVNRAFRTSMEVGVKVWVEDLIRGGQQHVSSAYLTFVAIDAERPRRPGASAHSGNGRRETAVRRSRRAPRVSLVFAARLNDWIQIQPHRDSLQPPARGRVVFHDQRIVSGDDVVGGIGQPVERVVAFEHFGDVIDHGERPALLKVCVQMRSVGGHHDPSAFCPDACDLQAGRMPSDAMHSESGRQFRIALVEHGFAGEDVLHHGDNVADVEGRAQRRMTHAPASAVCHLAILQMKARIRETIEIAGVIVMQMGQDDVGHVGCIDADRRQRIRRVAQQVALPSCGRLLRESGVDQPGAVFTAEHPDEVIEVGTEFVRIGQDEALARMAVSQMSVLEGDDFKRFRHALRMPYRTV